MNNPKKQSSFNSPIILGALVAAVCVVNVLFLYLSGDLINTIKLLRTQTIQLEEQKRIVDASSQILGQFNNEIDIISDAFPNDTTILTFIQLLESELKESSEEYKFTFSPAPITEGDKQYLRLTITLKTDLAKLNAFLGKLEVFPYLTHLINISAKTPAGFTGNSEYLLLLKLYVQNPFSS